MHQTHRRATRFALLPVAAAALAFSVHAQQGQPGSAPASQQQMQSSQPAQTAQQGQYRAIRAGDAVGASVRNAQGQDIGKIEDLIVDLRDGSVHYAVLSVDPGWFQSERLYSVPPSMLQFAQDREQIVLNQSVTREQLERGGIERDQWTPRFVNDQQQTGRLDRAWNQRRQQQAQQGQSTGGQQTAGASRLIRASDLMDRDVYNLNGDRIAEVDELVVNTARGQVHYAVVSFNRGWLREDRRTVLPLSAVQYDAQRDRLVMNVSAQQAQSLARFDERQYQNLNDRAFVAEVDRYLDSLPATIASASPATQGQAGPTRQMGAPAQPGTTGQGTTTR
jgi:sporulation protein YlmC with PRC-barrel domain